MLHKEKRAFRALSWNRTNLFQLRNRSATKSYQLANVLQVAFFTFLISLSVVLPSIPVYADTTDCDVTTPQQSGQIITYIKNTANQQVTITVKNNYTSPFKTISWTTTNGGSSGLSGAANVTAPSGWTYVADSGYGGGWQNSTGLAVGSSATFTYSQTTDATTTYSASSTYVVKYTGWTGTAFSGTNIGCRNPSSLTSTNTLNYYELAVSAPSPPVAPVLSGSNGALQNVLNWTACVGATSYNLKQGATSVFTGSATTFTDTGLTAGTSYSYSVTCTNSNGTSPPSNTVTLVPVTVTDTSQPTNLTVRDIQLISILITFYLSVTLIKPFRWKL